MEGYFKIHKMKKNVFSLIYLLLISNLVIAQGNRDPKSKDEANVFWDGTYPLYSLVSDVEIPKGDDGLYRFWSATNEVPTPNLITVKKGTQYLAYKFLSFEECSKWCSSKVMEKEVNSSQYSYSELKASEISNKSSGGTNQKFCYSTYTGKYELTLYDDGSKKVEYKLYSSNGRLEKTVQGTWMIRDEGIYGTAYMLTITWTGANSSLADTKYVCQYDGYGNLQNLNDMQNRAWYSCN